MLARRPPHGDDADRSREEGSGSPVFGPRETRFLRKRLRSRAKTLREEIRVGLIKYDDDQYHALADRVGDFEERSVADLLTDIDLSEIDRDVRELKDIEAALTRIAEGVYGVCVDCEEPISFERLEKLPSAARCHDCQERFERADPRPVYRKL